MLLVTASEMAELDRKTIEEIGIPGIVLMESAGRGAAEFFLEVLPDLLRRRITIVAGGGNNAGDGFVLARLFWNRRMAVRVVCLRPPERLKGDALTNFEIMQKLEVPVVIWDEEADFYSQWHWIRESDVIIDAILGTGLNSPVRGLYKEVITAVNTLSIPVLAVDVPSGLDASTGKILGTAIKSTATATFGLPKVGQLLPPGEELVGRLKVVDIGIAHRTCEEAQIQRWWLDQEHVGDWLQPREASTHKGQAGHIAVLAGSPGKTGAAALICEGAARVGAGLVTLFTPASLNPIMEVKLTEAMTDPIAETDAHTVAEAAIPHILEVLQSRQALATGPGLSLHTETQRVLKTLLLQAPCPLVLDADALTILADNLDLLREARSPLILTPHPGEMARLSRETTATVQENRLEIAAQFSRTHNVTLVLKGHRTIIAAADGRLAINSSGNPAMASGGMGDTLTGIITGLVGQGLEPFRAACLGVFIHGAAADRHIAKTATRGLLASDLLNHLPAVIGQLERFKGDACTS